jgi:hypothetical protein
VVDWGAGTTNSGKSPHCGQSVVPCSLTNVVAIAGDFMHRLAIDPNGTVIGEPPTIPVPPACCTNNAGTTATFTVNVNGTPPLNHQRIKAGTIWYAMLMRGGIKAERTRTANRILRAAAFWSCQPHFSLDRAGGPDTLVTCERAEPIPTWPRNIKTQILPSFPKNPAVNE